MKKLALDAYDSLVRSLDKLEFHRAPVQNENRFYNVEVTTGQGNRMCPFCGHTSFTTPDVLVLNCTTCNRTYNDRGKLGWELISQTERKF